MSEHDHEHHLSPVASAAKSIEDKYSKIDLARRSDQPTTTDPGLDPANQHRHGNKIYLDPSVPGRVDPHEENRHFRHSRQSHEVTPEITEKAVQVNEDTADSAEMSSDRRSQGTSTAWRRTKVFYHRHKWIVVLFFAMFFTSWWISIIAQKKTRHRWLIPTVLWILLMIRFITLYVRTRPLLDAANWVYQRTFIPVRDRIPQKLWPFCELFLLLMTILVATFATPEYEEQSLRKDRAVSFFGFVVFYAGFFVFSQHKRRIRWHTVIIGAWLQFIIALFVLRTKAGYDFFNWISFLARQLLGFAHDGISFLLSDDWVTQHPFFALTGLPSIVFFIAFIHIWYYWGVLQWVVGKFAYIFFWLMQISGAEAVVAAATPFVGQGESAILVKPFLKHMTDAEIFQILVSGFATVSGSMLASYISLGLNAGALITSCVMSIPASIAAAKMVIPETDEPLTSNQIVVPEDATEEAHNVVHAFSNGAWLGLQVALSIGTNILCIIALVALINALLGWFGKFWGIPQLTLEQIMGYIFYPVSFLIGVSRDGDLYKVAKLMGVKLVQNEFVAYTTLTSNPEYADLSDRSRMLATYALCGFSNIGSVGIQIGVLGSLCPERKATVAKLALLSLFVGCFVTMSSAATAGMVMAQFERFNEDSTTSS